MTKFVSSTGSVCSPNLNGRVTRQELVILERKAISRDFEGAQVEALEPYTTVFIKSTHPRQSNLLRFCL